MTRSMISPALSDHWNARSASSWISASWRPSASSEASTRPIGGPHCGSAMRLTIIRSSTCWTSSSRSISTRTRSAVDASAATRSACAGIRQPFAEPARDLCVAQFGLDDLRRHEVLAHECPEAFAELVLLALDDRGVRDRDTQRVLEQRGDREPVGQRADHARFRRGPDVADPGGGSVGLGPGADQEDHRRAEQETTVRRPSSAAARADVPRPRRCPRPRATRQNSAEPDCGDVTPAARTAARMPRCVRRSVCVPHLHHPLRAQCAAQPTALGHKIGRTIEGN